MMRLLTFSFFFFNDTATPEFYTLSLHDALPICRYIHRLILRCSPSAAIQAARLPADRKSTRLNSSHVSESRMPPSACTKKRRTLFFSRDVELRRRDRKRPRLNSR